MNRPTLRQLEYAVAVAEHRHFQRAAKACAVTQPGLSAQIQQLEGLLGVQLFERRRRGVLVTPAGEALVARARQILADVDDLVLAGQAAARPLCGELRLGVIPTVAPYLLPRVLPEVRRRHPELRLKLREDQTARLVESLAEGRLDVLLLALEAPLGDAETLPLFEDPFRVAVAPGHPLARRKRLREADLEGGEVLLLEDGHCLRDQALSLCGAAGASEVADLRASSLATLIQMVAGGEGITLVPELALDVVEAAGLVTIPFEAPAPHRTIGLAWRRSSPRGDELRLLAESLHP